MATLDSSNAVKAKLASLTGADINKIHVGSRLYHDLGLAGTDYQEFLQWLADSFNLDLSDVKMADLSPTEAFTIQLWPRKYLPLQVSDILKVIETGEWLASDYSKTKFRTRFGRRFF